jgi:hypothetical protein
MSSAGLWRSAAAPAALGSLVSLAAQALMALFLLGLFEPEAVGVFSVVAQTAFGWATLALAQSPLSLLAERGSDPVQAARQALQRSLRRALWLAPFAALALMWASQNRIGHSDALPGWPQLAAWTAATALCQMGWLLAQSLALRTQSPLSIAGVRMAPPVLAAALAAALAWGLAWRSGSALLLSALSGYALGCLWWRLPAQTHADAPAATMHRNGDNRSESLKLLHTLADVTVATALALQWSAAHGAAEAGCLLILLRVLGFVPALVSTAWAQVVLSRPDAARPSSLWTALAGILGVTSLAGGIALALHQSWLPTHWDGLQTYLLPVGLWQAAACVIAAVSHRPFEQGRARAYSLQCLGIVGGQAALIMLPPLAGWSATAQIITLSTWLSLCLLVQSVWAAQLSDSQR